MYLFIAGFATICFAAASANSKNKRKNIINEGQQIKSIDTGKKYGLC